MRLVARFWWPILLFLTVVIVRIPSYFEPHWYGDEDIYLSIGNVLNRSGHLYTDVIDHKPPLLYWLTASLGSLRNLKLFLSVWLGLGLIGLDLLMKKMKFSIPSRILGLSIFILFSTLPLFEGNVFNAELVFITLTIWGMWCLWSGLFESKKYSVVISGACFGVAALFKIPAVFDFMAALIAIGFFAKGQKLSFKQTVYQLLTFLFGFGTPILLVVFALLSQGNFADFFKFAIGYNFQYMDDWSTVIKSPLITFLAPWAVRGGILVGSLAIVWFASKKFLSFHHRVVLTWLWLGLFGTLLSLRPYAHYFLQVLPAMALMAGLMVEKKTNLLRFGIFTLLFAVVWSLIHFLPVELFRTRGYYQAFLKYSTEKSWDSYATWFNGGVTEHYQLAEWINAHSKKQDTLFVWGNVPTLYAQTDISPATRFVTDYHIWSFNGFEEVYSTLYKSPPQFIADCRNDTEHFPKLRDLLVNYAPMYQTQNCKLFSHLTTDQMLQ